MEEVGEEHEVVYTDDSAFLVVLQYGVSETLVGRDVFFVRGEFVEEFGFGGVGECVVEMWPEDLMGWARLWNEKRAW